MQNIEKSELTSVSKTKSKVISLRGRRQVGCLNQLIQAVLCFAAGGHNVLPFFVCPRQMMKTGLLDGISPDMLASCHPD
jgi:hypothetical protein